MPELLEITQVAATRILVVDDDDAFRESVCAAIARDDDMVLAAQVNSVAAAREAIGHGDFDVALIDLGLPDGNGIDLIREAIRIKPSLPAVLLTGYGRPNESKAAVGLNISEVVHKPFTMEILAGAIHGALAPRAHPRS